MNFYTISGRMAESSADVVIVGGGIAGMTTASTWRSPACERRRRARRDRQPRFGFAYGGLSPLSAGFRPSAIAQDGMQLHRECMKRLLEETGNRRGLPRAPPRWRWPSPRAGRAAAPGRAAVASSGSQATRCAGSTIAEARRLEPRISDETPGNADRGRRRRRALSSGTGTHPGCRAPRRHGPARAAPIGLQRDGGRITGVVWSGRC